MNQLDVLYRALADYRKQTAESRECGVERKAIASANRQADALDVIKNVCTVEEDWITAIEEGLIHIEKAINEARQFIRSKGEVVQIEKVKRVSKESVEHLAKHSDLISKQQEGENLIPDKLYMVERLNDFAVYENRFLYMLLCQLRDFIGYRYDKILQHTSAYSGSITMNKTVAISKRKTVLELKMTDERQDDRYLRENNPLKPILMRIDAILKTVLFFLSTPLMQEVAKTPILKPPITKTNVLRMNRNFKGAVALYDFIMAYDKPGYSVEKRVEHISPLPDAAADELSETVMLIAFLTYKHGLGLEKLLKIAFEEEEARRKAAEADRLKEQLAQLKKRIAESKCDPAEYMLLLEKRIKTLEADSTQLSAARVEIEKLNALTAELKENITSLHTEIDALKSKHAEERARLIAYHEKETADILARHKAETEQLNSLHSQHIQALNTAHDGAISALKEMHKEQIEKKDGIIVQLEATLKEEEARFNEETEKLTAQLNEKTQEYHSLSDAKSLSDAQLNALRKEHGLISADEDFTSQAAFNELERQLKIFKSFIKEEWQKTKKKIRKDVFKPEAKPAEEKTTVDS